MNNYRDLHNQYAQGMQQQNTVMPNRQPGFNFLQGWNTSPHAGYMPPQQAQHQARQYGMARPNAGQPAPMAPQAPQPWRRGFAGTLERNWPQRNAQQMQPMQPEIQANYGMQQPMPMPKPMPFGQMNPSPYKPQPIDQLNPGRDPNSEQGQASQYDQYGKPISWDQVNPGRPVNPWGGG